MAIKNKNNERLKIDNETRVLCVGVFDDDFYEELVKAGAKNIETMKNLDTITNASHIMDNFEIHFLALYYGQCICYYLKDAKVYSAGKITYGKYLKRRYYKNLYRKMQKQQFSEYMELLQVQKVDEGLYEQKRN